MGGGGPRGGGIARGGARPSLGAGPRSGRSAYRGRGGSGQYSARATPRYQAGRNWNRGGRYAYRNYGKHDRRHYRNRDVFIYGAPFLGYGAYAYAGDCYWLRQRALATGSAYWWDRYNACVAYDYY
jgi:hypothetical protein